jgi:nitronate monooxygenase
MLHTRLCDILGIEHPIVSAPMAGFAAADLVAAVSAAGGFGLIGATIPAWEDNRPAWLRDQIRAVRERTDRPFGVGVVLGFPQCADLVRVALAERVAAVAYAFGDAAPLVDASHDAGCKVLVQVQTVAQAAAAARAGADVVVAQGTDAGGHCGLNGTLAFVPAVVDAVAPMADIPVLAAGGIADGRGVAAVLMLGAAGAWIGTRFFASHEAVADPWRKERIVAASVDDTVWTMAYDRVLDLPAFPDGIASRVLRTAFTEAWDGRDAEIVARRAELLAHIGVPDDEDGDAIWAGQAVGLIHAVEPAAAILERIVAEAERVLRDRPAALLR